jgi:hypothetical protein
MTDDPSQAGAHPPADLPRYPAFNPWAAPDAGQPPYGSGIPPARPRSRVLVWVAAAVVAAVVISLVGGGFLIARNHSASTVGRAAPVAPASSLSASPSGSSAPSSPAAPTQSAGAPAPSESPSAPALGAAPDAGTGPLDKYVLSPAEEGAGAMMFLIGGGRGVTPDNPTLDFCNFTYTSEKLRAARVQVQYAGGSAKPAGNEFVKYQTGGTTKAFIELQQAVASCPATTQTDGVTYSQRLRAPREAGLVSHQLILSFEIDDPTGSVGLPWQAVVYQFDGNYFSGIYTYGTTRALALAQAERLALLSAHHLAEAVAGKAGTGGGPFASFATPSDNGVQV